MLKLTRVSVRLVAAAVGVLAAASAVSAQAPAPAPARPVAQSSEPVLPVDYVIGVDDVLTIAFWREPDLSADVVVRPDGKITLSVFNDVQAAGLTPEQLRVKLTDTARSANVLEAPNVMVRVKEIKSRFVSIVGEVAKQGQVPINGPMSVMQLLSLAGGLTEFADKKKILITRSEGGKEQTFIFNYADYSKGRPAALKQNIQLKPGDTVVVPE